MRVKVLSMGPGGSGKSCIIKRYCEEKFVQKYIATIGVDYGVKPVTIAGKQVRVNFWDLSGREEFFDVRNEFYKDTQDKFRAIAKRIRQHAEKGQPVLVGTVSIEKSELLSEFLRQEGVDHSVLNARYHEQEAHIVAQAGRLGAVTIATNMAGRGTDIQLGGNLEFRVDDELAGMPEGPERDAAIEQIRAEIAAEKDKVLEAGGLFVLGTERHESRRIDNQLRGRSGRQGDPGLSRFYLSLDDDRCASSGRTRCSRG